MRVCRVLALVQLPPPVHGASTMNSAAVAAMDRDPRLRVRTVAIRSARTIGDVRRVSVAKLVGALQLVRSVVLTYILFRPQLVYFTLAPSGPALIRDTAIAVILRLFGARLVLHLHGIGIRRAASSPSWRVVLRYVFRGQDAIVLSERLAADLSAVEPRYTHIVPNGIPDIGPKSDHGRSGIVRLLFLSHLSAEKGLFTLLRAVARLRTTAQWRLELAGEFMGTTKDELDRTLNDLSLVDSVSYLGPKYGPEKWRTLACSDVLVLPSYNEAMPLVLIEAMMMGVPVVSTRVGSIPALVGHEYDGLLVSAGDSAALCDALRELVEQRELRDSLGANGRRSYEQNYTIDRFEHCITETMSRIAKRRLATRWSPV